MLTGPNGLLTQAKDAKTKTDEAGAKEKVQMAVAGSWEENGFSAEKFKTEIGRFKGEIIPGEEEFPIQVTVDGQNFEVSEEGIVTEKGKSTPETPQTPTTQEPVEAPEISENGEFSRANGKIDIEFLTGTSYTIGEANKPQIDSENMIPVNWNGTDWVVTDESNWEYSYDETEKKWANVMLRDTLILDNMTNEQVQTASIEDMKNHTVTQEGSMLVWIPRYAYKITYYETEAKTPGTEIGYSDARGIVDKNGKTPNDINAPVTSIAVGENYYRPHPAFEDNSSTSSEREYSQGEWREKLQGIWFGKFETTEKVNEKITIRPNQASYTKQTVGTFYEDARNLGIANSHMAKNSEWGAMAYLTESKYGRNGETVDKNANSSYITGSKDYKNVTNLGQSTTNNIYGIYDTSGGTYEYTTGYIADNSQKYGNSFASTDDTKNNKTESTEYATVYEMASGNDYTENYKTNVNKVFGDGILETSTDGTGITSWHSSNSYFVGLHDGNDFPFGDRGGHYNSSYAGIFCLDGAYGNNYNYFGFRTCCIVK